VAHTVSLFVVLAAVWLLLSGHFTAFLLTLGLLSCLFVVYIAHRMDVVDHESHPLHIGHLLPIYWVWLIKEIIKANIDVTKRILNPKLPISPVLFTVPATQRTDLGKVIYANSITLTPGTVSTDVGADTIQVHALSEEGAEDLRGGAMGRRVTEFEGKP